MIRPIFVMPKLMRLRSTILLLVLLLCHNGYAQLQNNNWCFGERGGVSFSGGAPTSFNPTLSTNEGVATVSSSTTGALLFYCSTSDVYNSSYNIMPNGMGVNTDTFSTCTQGVNIVPFINDTNKYYVFTLTAEGTSGRLSYSIVDMTLDNGLGDVVSGQKYIPIDSGFTEAMVVAEGCNNYWLITCKKGSASFYAYEITAAGINLSPVVSVAGYMQTNGPISAMKISPDGTMLCLSSLNAFPNSFLALHDFDVSSGVISSGKLIDTSDSISFYGCEFSPDSRRLYATSEKPKSIYQYDLTQMSAAAIMASRQIVYKSVYPMGGLQIGPDSNIYVAVGGVTRLGSISNANALFPGCVYTPNVVTLKNASFTKLGLPQAVVNPINNSQSNPTTSLSDTLVCLKETIVLYGRVGYWSYEWQNGSSSDSFIVSKAGKYWVRSSKECLNMIDTVVVVAHDMIVQINNDTTICIGDELTLRSNAQPSGTNFTWSNGSTTDTTVIKQSGRYQLKATYKGCSDTDEVIVTHYPRINIELGNDTQICKGNAFMLPQIESSDFDAKYLWQDGSTGRTFEVPQAGKYQVTLSNQCQTIKDSVIVTGRNCHFFFPSGFTPNGDGRNDIARLVGDVGAVQDFTLRIFNRWGELVYLTDNPTLGWDGNYKNQKAEVGVYYYQIQYTYLGEKELMKGDLMLVR